MFWKNALEILTLPTIATLLLFIYYHYFKNEQKTFQLYFNYYFALMLIKLFIFTIQAHAVEYIESNYTENYTQLFTSNEFNINECSNKFVEMRVKEELFFLKDVKCLSNTQVKEYKRRQAYELKEGHRCFNQANKLCLMIPNSTDKEKAGKLFQVAIATAAGYAVSGYGGVMMVLITELSIYLKNSVDEYQQMQSLLLEAQAHYDLSAFYQEVLDKS